MPGLLHVSPTDAPNHSCPAVCAIPCGFCVSEVSLPVPAQAEKACCILNRGSNLHLGAAWVFSSREGQVAGPARGLSIGISRPSWLDTARPFLLFLGDDIAEAASVLSGSGMQCLECSVGCISNCMFHCCCPHVDLMCMGFWVLCCVCVCFQA